MAWARERGFRRFRNEPGLGPPSTPASKEPDQNAESTRRLPWGGAWGSVFGPTSALLSCAFCSTLPKAQSIAVAGRGRRRTVCDNKDAALLAGCEREAGVRDWWWGSASLPGQPRVLCLQQPGGSGEGSCLGGHPALAEASCSEALAGAGGCWGEQPQPGSQVAEGPSPGLGL